MDINTLKETLGDAKFTELQAFVTDLTGQRDTARNESINGRKGKQSTIDKQTARIAALEDYVGIEPDADIEQLPPLRQQLDASKQADAKVKRAERERDEAKAERDAASGKYRGSLQRAAIAEALGGHEFVARDIVETFVSQRLAWEGEDLLFKTDDGKLVPVKDGVAGLAKARPELLKPAGTGGAGVRQSNAGGGGQKTMARAEFEALAPAARVEAAKAGVQLT